MRIVLKLASGIYLAGYGLRKRLYKAGIRKAKRLKRTKVISIGNLSVGGTGKTPFVSFLARELSQQALTVAIVSRGYKGRANKNPTIVSNTQQTIIMDYREVGDEALMLARALEGIPVVIGRRRYDASRLAEEDFNPHTILLDDGFQHWGLARDLDIVLFDCSQELSSLRLLPEGRLREPLSALARADIVILNKCNLANSKKIAALENIVSGKAPQALFIHSDLTLQGIRKIKDHREILPAEFLNGKKIIAFCGIAQPDSFFEMLSQEGAEIMYPLEFPDHYSYTVEDIRKIETAFMAKNGELIITTEKDAVKIETLISAELPYYLTQISTALFPDEAGKFWGKIYSVLRE